MSDATALRDGGRVLGREPRSVPPAPTTASGSPRPTHRPPLYGVLLVAAGGAVGTLSRAGLGLVLVTPPGALPVATLTANLTGAFLLGVLLALLDRRRDDRTLRPLLGTGLLGGFTTASTLSVELSRLAVAAPLLALAYLVVTVAGGLVAGAAGLALGRSVARRRQRR